ncbi:hypothetical protein A2715_05670 [Candidatus Woesebacteria bacterium RIFCSPHIGHO2_01_FULL_39_32]|uniref:O-antigen ligase-related domain-containing protein n=1 Tax=Candidatus Woesebacteria bacterium RIFCSPLOWO2_01_FULL_39_25 TaxID=1802521 RepID=A0A1F8BN10_9BACT|nr:MAG: hypothetical protein A2715_05670 [Candidatus Woesebacteria bacterium RIFCSPHIGHO2_01_FULL_39_32]OGM36788.1 MAG: hypothetical protein A3F01_00140 [Candidatus Woesebacteria bacterium RIFCSPHIGHO2_12_FULL_38_11]OGM65039.1 MAG: hypothetical protein A2893_05280 [Candidatus Woesebacteria bacterium RIFCSPLOWO2_01_FULL_39_25]
MDASKKIYQKLGVGIVFLYLLFYPFGQLLRFNFQLTSEEIPIHAVDIIALISIPLIIVARSKKPNIDRAIKSFLIIAFFSNVLSLYFFPLNEVLVNSLYLLRIFAYYSFFVLVWNLIVRKALDKKILYAGLISLSVFAAIFGWIQYFWLPDLTSLKYIGWDDHLYRLVGTYLDPGFTGIILVMGFLLVSNLFLQEKGKYQLVIAFFLFISVLFTYSRASYLALLLGMFTLAWLKKKKKLLTLMVLAFIFIVPLLPRPKSEGARLERTQSVYARLNNYRQTFSIISEYPLFGVGFNNICSARIEMFGGSNDSHACSGADSSLLFVTATTGVLGLITFLYMGLKVFNSINFDLYRNTFLTLAFTIVGHSFFVNSMFYPWVMGFMAILFACAIKEHT